MAHDLIDTKLEDFQSEKDKKKHDRFLSDIRAVIKTPEGRRFYWRVMEEGKVFDDQFAGETNQTMYNLGRQAISRNFLKYLLDAKPEALQQMQEERAAEERIEKNTEEKIKESAPS